MATIRSYTTIEQSRKLAEILPIESADMCYPLPCEDGDKPLLEQGGFGSTPCWSLSSLLKYLSEIKPQVYTPILFPSEAKWILQFAEYGHGNVCEVSCENPVDACVAMIEKLHELNLL